MSSYSLSPHELVIDSAKYKGKWVAIINNEVVADSISFATLFEEVKKRFPKAKPAFDWVDSNPYHIFKRSGI